MIVGLPREIMDGEFRVGLTPCSVTGFVAHGHTVLVEQGLGKGSSFSDTEMVG